MFNISRRNLYNHSKIRQTQDEALKDKILGVLDKHPSYGHRRIALELRIGKRRARRVMRKFGIKPYKRCARWRKRRDLKRPEAEYRNLIKGSSPIKPGVVLVGDFTHIIHQSKIVYLATYMDQFTREIVGWSISNKHTKELVIEALLDAIKNLDALPKIVHTDQGSEYCSQEYTKFLKDLRISISMSKKASPWENGYQESFYNNFKTDLGLEFDRFDSLGELIVGVHQTINYYNKARIHTSLKMTPEEFRSHF